MPPDSLAPPESDFSSALTAWLTSPLPFLPAGEAAGNLLAGVGGQIPCDQAALLWRSDSEGVLQGTIWRRSGEIIESRLPESLVLQDLTLLKKELPEPFDRLFWRLLPGKTASSSIPLVYLGIESAEQLQRLPPAWDVLIPGILRWSVQFEEMLRDRTLAAMAEYAAGAGHEINNPLGSIIGRTSQLLKSETNDEKRRVLESIGAQAYRIRDMIGDTMLFANPPLGRPQPVLMNGMIQNVLHQFGGDIADSQVNLQVEAVEPVFILVDPDQFDIVVSELIRNSLTALRDIPSEKSRELTIRCHWKEHHGVQGGELELRDTGPGLTPDQQQHCFNPFYSGRQAGRGLGFGLSKCWRIVQQHQGTISLSCDQGQTRVRVWFPATDPPFSAESP